MLINVLMYESSCTCSRKVGHRLLTWMSHPGRQVASGCLKVGQGCKATCSSPAGANHQLLQVEQVCCINHHAAV